VREACTIGIARRRAVALNMFDRIAVQGVLEGNDTVINLATHMLSSTFKMMLLWQWRENDLRSRTKTQPRRWSQRSA
jgi:hypothetical protein